MARVRRERLAGGLRGGPGRRGARVAHDGGGRSGHALGGPGDAVLGGGPEAAVALRAGGGLADHVGGAGEALLRGREADRGGRGAGPEGPGPEVGAVPDAADAADVQPDSAEGVGGEERDSVLDDAAGEEHGGVRRTERVQEVRHVRDLPDGGEVLSGLHAEAAPGGEEDRATRPDARAAAGASRRAERGGEGAGGEGGRDGGGGGVPGARVRARRGHGLEPALAAPLCVLALPERSRQHLRPRGTVHDRPPLAVGGRRPGPAPLPGAELQDRPRDAPLLQERTRRSLRAPRHQDPREPAGRRPRLQGGSGTPRRPGARRLAGARRRGIDAAPSVLRDARVPRERSHPPRGRPQPLWGPPPPDVNCLRRGHSGARRPHARSLRIAAREAGSGQWGAFHRSELCEAPQPSRRRLSHGGGPHCVRVRYVR